MTIALKAFSTNHVWPRICLQSWLHVGTQEAGPTKCQLNSRKIRSTPLSCLAPNFLTHPIRTLQVDQCLFCLWRRQWRHCLFPLFWSLTWQILTLTVSVNLSRLIIFELPRRLKFLKIDQSATRCWLIIFLVSWKGNGYFWHYRA